MHLFLLLLLVLLLVFLWKGHKYNLLLKHAFFSFLHLGQLHMPTVTTTAAIGRYK